MDCLIKVPNIESSESSDSDSPFNKRGVFTFGDFVIRNLSGARGDWGYYEVSFFKRDQRVLRISEEDLIYFGYSLIWDPSQDLDTMHFVKSILETEKKVYERCSSRIKKREIILNEDSYARGNDTTFKIETGQDALSILQSYRNFQNFMRLMACNDYATIGLISCENPWNPRSRSSEISFTTSYEPNHYGYINLNDIITDFFFETSRFKKEDLIIPNIQPIYQEI